MATKTPQDYANELMAYTGTNEATLKMKAALPRIQQSVIDIYYTEMEDDEGKHRLWRCNLNDISGDVVWEECYEPSNPVDKGVMICYNTRSEP